MELSYEEKMRIIEKNREEKWRLHRATDFREELIDGYESTNIVKLTQNQLEKVRQMIDSYLQEGKEFKQEYIQVIIDYDNKRKEKEEKIKRIELDER